MVLASLVTIALNCSLAGDIVEQSKTRMIYLQGEAEQTTSQAEKATLDVEVVALQRLRDLTLVWKAVNCQEKK